MSRRTQHLLPGQQLIYKIVHVPTKQGKAVAYEVLHRSLEREKTNSTSTPRIFFEHYVISTVYTAEIISGA